MTILATGLYAATRRVADIFHENVSHDPSQIDRLWVADIRNNVVSPLVHQTQTGLYLTCIDLPRTLWTPWGEWRFTGDYSGTVEQMKQATQALLQHLEVELQPDLSQGRDSVYAILAVDRRPMPFPALRAENWPHEWARHEWRRLTAAYDANLLSGKRR